MKKELVIEWNKIEKTPGAFEETGMALPAVLAEIKMLLELEGVSVQLIERVAESESLLFNGIPIEDLLEGVEVTTTACSCVSCESCGEGGECRTLRYNGEEYEAIPPELIGRAAAKALELE